MIKCPQIGLIYSIRWKHIHFAIQRYSPTNNTSPPSAAYLCRWNTLALVKVMACRLFDAKPLPEPILTYCQFDLKEQASVQLESKL